MLGSFLAKGLSISRAESELMVILYVPELIPRSNIVELRLRVV